MYYVYLIKIKDRAKHSYHIGYTSDLKKRIADHKKDKGEIELIYYEAYQTEKMARTREKIKAFWQCLARFKTEIELGLEGRIAQ